MKINLLSILSLFVSVVALTSCSDSKSYADLLNEENQLVNAYLAEFRVEESWPGVDNCEVGEDAPYYRVDSEGNVYMQVLKKGDGTYPETNQHVYFRYTSYDLNYYIIGDYDNNSYIGSGNKDNVGISTNTYFVYDNYTISQSSQFGTGIQIPVKLLGFDSEVNMILKSQAGPTATMSYVIPYLYNITYYQQRSIPQ